MIARTGGGERRITAEEQTALIWRMQARRPLWADPSLETFEWDDVFVSTWVRELGEWHDASDSEFWFNATFERVDDLLHDGQVVVGDETLHINIGGGGSLAFTSLDAALVGLRRALTAAEEMQRYMIPMTLVTETEEDN